MNSRMIDLWLSDQFLIPIPYTVLGVVLNVFLHTSTQ